ncbi:MAG: hypothetical protein LN588_04130 [Rickettsia endosymbiont of Bryobia graminum]|nr:hypothetical protein [Rickettsia endosymbiont of Bryobia graminum]
MLNNWKDKLTKVQIKLTEVKEHKTLKEQFVLAQQVEKLSEITGVSVVEISELRLESKSIKQITSAVLQNPKTIESLKKL